MGNVCYYHGNSLNTQNSICYHTVSSSILYKHKQFVQFLCLSFVLDFQQNALCPGKSSKRQGEGDMPASLKHLRDYQLHIYSPAHNPLRFVCRRPWHSVTPHVFSAQN